MNKCLPLYMKPVEMHKNRARGCAQNLDLALIVLTVGFKMETSDMAYDSYISSIVFTYILVHFAVLLWSEIRM